VQRDDLLQGRKPDAGSEKFCFRTGEALEWEEQPVRILAIEAGAVVPDNK
jgi:hypothetical protein